MNQTWDAGGEASAALLHVVEGFGSPVLGRADMLEGLLADDVPQLPREIAMLTEAARFGVASLLSERVQQGVEPQAAVAMVANEMTSRTAVDAAGALWAADVFARATGLPAGPPATGVAADAGATIAPTVAGPPVSTPPVGPTPAGPTRVMASGTGPGIGFPSGPTAPELMPSGPTMADGPPQTRRLDGGPELYGPPPTGDQQTILPGQPGFPGYPGYTSPWAAQAPVPGAAGNSQGLAVVAAICFGIAALMQPFVGLGSHIGHAAYLVDWATAIAELILFAGAAIWVGRSKGSATGFAVTLGLAVPAIPLGIYTALFVPNYGNPGIEHSILLLTTIVWLLASVVAAFVGIAGLSQQRQLTRVRSAGPAAAAAILGTLFALANIGAQLTVPGSSYDSPDDRYGIFGTGVSGVHIFWGLVLIVLFSVPPLLAWVTLPARETRIGLLCAWLLITFIWQIGDTPIGILVAAPGLYLTWIAWLATLLATAAMALWPPQQAVDLRS
jgi:hypothetical protein